MAAPSTVYKDYMARRRKAGTPNVDIDLYIAKFLQNTTPPSGDDWGDGYFNAADIPPTAADWSAANAKIKAIFKVDGFLCVPKGTTENGFIGFCYSRTSGNGLYHKTERFSGVRVPTTAHADAELLNDGGLNVKGHCQIYSVLSGSSTAYNDSATTYKPRLHNMFSWAYFRSAFYDSSVLKIEVQNPADQTWQNAKDVGTLAPKIFDTYKTDISDNTMVERIGTYNFRAIITNGEGTWYSAPVEAIIYRALATMKYNATYASDAYGGSTTSQVYYDTNEIVSTQGGVGLEATTFAKNDVTTMGGSDISDYGFYVLGSTWYEYRYWEAEAVPIVVRTGACSNWGWPTDDPAYRFYPIFDATIYGQFSEATLGLTSSTKSITSGDTDYGTTIPSFPDATYSIVLNYSVALNNVPIYIYIRDASSNAYLISTTTTGSGATVQYTLNGSFSTIGLLPLAGETYNIFVTDESL